MAGDQQSAALAQVNEAVAEMDKVTQQNAAMVEENEAAAQGLSDETATLAGLLARFDTDGGASSDDRRIKRSPGLRAAA